jgi:hypothetical protein
MVRTLREEEPARGLVARARGEGMGRAHTHECTRQELPVAGTMESQITE